MSINLRKPIVAGTFYPSDKNRLRKDLSSMVVRQKKNKAVIAVLSPHAGYFYSGECAGKTFGAVKIPDRVIILGVNHGGTGYSYAIDSYDEWITPLGSVKVDLELREQLVEKSKIFKIDERSGINEHSIEVQIPFLQYINPNVRILPILISGYSYRDIELGGLELARLIEENNKDDILIIASTDMSHYISAELAKVKDGLAIEKIENLESEELLSTVIDNKISMCGVLPVTMALVAAKALNATQTQIIDYTNSGVKSGDYNQVVGYLGMTIF